MPDLSNEDRRLLHYRSQSSPFDYPGNPPARPVDASHQVTCPQCHARFIGIGERSAEANLARHQADRHAPKRGAARAAEIRRLYTTGEWTERQLAEKFGLALDTIRDIVLHKTWT